jgi:site-specific recombinase XerD
MSMKNYYPQGAPGRQIVKRKRVNENRELEPGKPRLFDQVRDKIRAKHYSIRTEETYLQWIKRYIFFHNKRHPVEMGAKEISQYLSHLAVQAKVASSTQNQALCAIVFLYKQVLEVDPGDFSNLVRAKKPQRLPVVFSKDEVKRVLIQLEGTNKSLWVIYFMALG